MLPLIGSTCCASIRASLNFWSSSFSEIGFTSETPMVVQTQYTLLLYLFNQLSTKFQQPGTLFLIFPMLLVKLCFLFKFPTIANLLSKTFWAMASLTSTSLINSLKIFPTLIIQILLLDYVHHIIQGWIGH